MGMVEDELEGGEVTGGRGEAVSVGSGDSVPRSVGVNAAVVDVETGDGETGRTVAVDCGSSTST